MSSYEILVSGLFFILVLLWFFRQHKSIVLKFLNNLREARNRVGIGLSYRPARLHRLAESIPRNRFLSSLIV
jgi:hypothetical protein